MEQPKNPARALALASLACALACGCSVRRLAVDGLAAALAEGQSVYASDSDPELVRAALPFALKTLEALLVESPESEELLLAATSGFTLYSSGFVERDAELVESTDWAAAERLRERALGLYLRALGYGLRGLELRHQGLGERLRQDPWQAVLELDARELDLVYWTAAAWGSAVGIGLDQPAIAADLDAVRALFARALALDEGYGKGVLHEALIAIESLPAMMGGSPDRARAHFERAVLLSAGASATPFVTWAVHGPLAAQDRAEFELCLGRALAVDPDAEPTLRLSNRIAQERARALLAQADELFVDSID